MNSDQIYLVVVPLIRPWVRANARRRRAQFEAAPPTPGRVVFLGDSITEGGLWDAWFQELPALNRGISGDTTEDILARLDSAIDQPAAVCLLIGTNDLHGLPRLRDLDGVASRLREILRRIQEAAPDTPIFLNSVMPRTAWFAPRLKDLNKRYRRIAEQMGVTYVDLWPALAKDDALRKEFTYDNLHLTAEGYRARGASLTSLQICITLTIQARSPPLRRPRPSQAVRLSAPAGRSPTTVPRGRPEL